MGTLFQSTAESRLARALLGLPDPAGPNVTISMFLDEGAGDILLAARVWAALGGDSFAGRSCIYADKGTHFEDLSPDQLVLLLGHIFQETGVQMDEFGLRLGKIKLLGGDDVNVRGTVMPKVKYFDYVKRTVELGAAVANNNRTRRSGSPRLAMRLFDCYPGPGRTIEECFGEAVEVTGRTLAICKEAGLEPGVETECGLTGQNAENMLRMSRELPAYRPILDLGNLDSSGFGDEGACEQAERLLDIVAGWMHWKAFLGQPGCKPGEPIDEAAINAFGPFHLDGAHRLFLPKLAKRLFEIEQRNQLQPGRFRGTLEPHFLKGGQFGGFTSLKGMGIALRSMLVSLTEAGIGYRLAQYLDIRPDNRALVESC